MMQWLGVRHGSGVMCQSSLTFIQDSSLKRLVKKEEGMFLYGAVSSPLDRSKRFMPHRQQTCSFRHQLDFSGKNSATLQLLCEDYLLTFSPLSIASVE